MKLVVVGMLAAAVRAADVCTAAQKSAMLEDARAVVDALVITDYSSASQFVTAATVAIGTLDYPCTDCLQPYLTSYYIATGSETSVCAVDSESTACKNLQDAADAALALCASTGVAVDISGARSVGLGSVAFVAAAFASL